VKDHPRAPEILYALLWDTGWPESADRAHPKSDPADYCSRTVLAALNARNSKDKDRLKQLAERYVLPTSSDSLPDAQPTVPDQTVLDANLLSGGAELTTAIQRFAALDRVDEFSRSHGWRRFPVLDIVLDIAEIFGVSRETVRQEMAALANAGIIERRSDPYRHDGAIRRDTCIRLPRGGK
jgi:DNA-binding transcriptional ArsR family regulator